MNSLSRDLLLNISKFLDNNTCCELSDLHKLSLTNKYNFKIYKEKIIIIPLIHSKLLHKIYTKNNTPLHSNCYLCGPFNKIETTNIINSIDNALRIDHRLFCSLPRPYPKGLSNTIHFSTLYEMDILKTKAYRLTDDLNFLIAGRCCDGKGSTLYLKH